MQYTVRGIPKRVDEEIRRRARRQGRSLNEVAVDALIAGLGLGGERVVRRDLTGIAGTWRKDPDFDAAMAAQHTIDENLWE